jgi:putative acetyltransferase
MGVTVRFLRPGELRLYLEIVARAIRGGAGDHYPPEAIEGWAPKATDGSLHELMVNADGEVRLIAELDGTPAGIGALAPAASELRACYVVPEAMRRGCGAAIVREIERLAKEHGVARLELAASLNAEPFYTALGYRVRERSQVRLSNGHELCCVWMEKDLEPGESVPPSTSTRA